MQTTKLSRLKLSKARRLNQRLKLLTYKFSQSKKWQGLFLSIAATPSAICESCMKAQIASLRNSKRRDLVRLANRLVKDKNYIFIQRLNLFFCCCFILLVLFHFHRVITRD